MADEMIEPTGPTPLGAEQWQALIQAAKDKRDKVASEQGWAKRIDVYLGKPLDAMPKDDTVVVPKDYANVEQKKAQLFSQLPDVHMAAQRDEFAEAVPVAQAIVRDLVSVHGVHAEAVMDEVIFDALCPAGLMCSKIGYEAFTAGEKPMAPPVDPVTQQPMGPPTMVPNIVFERYYWERFSPKKALIPADFHGSDYDKAPWLGMEFELDEAVAMKRFGIAPPASGEDTSLNRFEAFFQGRGAPKKVKGAEIWYRPALVDGTSAHPEEFRRLILLDGKDIQPQITPSPYQTVNPDGTISGLTRNPIRIGALRYVSDSAFPPSDCAVSAPLVEELSMGRTQMVQQRKRNMPMIGADRTRVTTDDLDKIEKGTVQGIILTEGPAGDVFQEIRKGAFPRENFTFNDYTDRDIAEAWALSNTPDYNAQGSKTATEASLFQGKSDTRLRRERARVLKYYVLAVECLFTLVQKFATDTYIVRVAGADAVAAWHQWTAADIAGEFAFSAKPDSAVFQDQAFVRKQATEVFQFLAPSPFVNQQALTQWYLQQMDMEPTKFLAQPEPPKPETPKVSFSFKGDDLNPQNPQYSIVLEVMRQAGFQISAGAAAMSLDTALHAPLPEAPGEPRQSGTAPTQSPLNKHAHEETGRNNAGLAPGAH